MKKAVCLLLMLSNLCYAAPCDRQEYDKAQHFASIEGEWVVNNRYEGGKNIRTEMTSCEYNSYSNKFKVGMDIYWEGRYSGDTYNSEGYMEMNQSGSSRHYTETYRNQNLKDYVSNRNTTAVVVTILGVLGAAAASSE